MAGQASSGPTSASTTRACVASLVNAERNGRRREDGELRSRSSSKSPAVPVLSGRDECININNSCTKPKCPGYVYERRHEVSVFMEKKGAEVPAFADTLWMCNSARLVYTTENLNLPNVQLQGREQPINDIFQFVSAFETKLRLWETQLRDANYVHFMTLVEYKPDSPKT